MSKKIRSMEVDLELGLLDCFRGAMKGKDLSLQEAMEKEIEGPSSEPDPDAELIGMLRGRNREC